MRSERLGPRASVLALSVVLAACGGVTSQSQPRDIAEETVPFELLDEQRPAAPSEREVGVEAFVVYLVDAQERLVEVPRSRPPSPSAAEMLRALFDAPTQAETEAGFRSHIPPDLEFQGVGIDDDVVTIDLAGTLEDAQGSEDPSRGLAQIVYTVTQRARRERVKFEIEGRPVEIPLADGTLTRRAVTRDDFPRGT